MTKELQVQDNTVFKKLAKTKQNLHFFKNINLENGIASYKLLVQEDMKFNLLTIRK